jgi:hypothetical protein
MDDSIRDLERKLLAARNRMGEPPYVVIRSRDSGAHAGLLEYDSGDGRVVLRDARRLWHWNGAATLSEVATVGVDSKSCRFGSPVRITVMQVCEIIDTTAEARRAIEAAPVWKPNANT